jgi:hypothetical protein
MEKPEGREAREGWEAATWEGARKARLRAALSATPAQRLAWLEEALELACRAGALERWNSRKAGRGTA